MNINCTTCKFLRSIDINEMKEPEDMTCQGVCIVGDTDVKKWTISPCNLYQSILQPEQDGKKSKLWVCSRCHNVITVCDDPPARCNHCKYETHQSLEYVDVVLKPCEG